MSEELEKRIKLEIRKFNDILKNVSRNKMKVARGLIERAAFMKVTLEELESKVNQEGVLDRFEQGDYVYDREHPALKSYNTTVKNYSNVCKQLFDLIPKSAEVEEDDGFDDFLESRK